MKIQVGFLHIVVQLSILISDLYGGRSSYSVLDYVCTRQQQQKRAEARLLQYAFKGEIENVQKLLEKGTNGNAQSCFGSTPLHYAVSHNNFELVHYLLKTNKVKLDIPDEDGLIPLHWAISTQNKRIVKLLLSYNTQQTNIKDSQGRSPLFLAFLYNDLNIIRLILDKMLERKELFHVQTPLKKLILHLNDDKACLLFTYGIKINQIPTDCIWKLYNNRVKAYKFIYNNYINSYNVYLNKGSIISACLVNYSSYIYKNNNHYQLHNNFELSKDYNHALTKDIIQRLIVDRYYTIASELIEYTPEFKKADVPGFLFSNRLIRCNYSYYNLYRACKDSFLSDIDIVTLS